MKKLTSLLLAALMLLSIAAVAAAQTETNALDAFEQFTGQSLSRELVWANPSSQYLDEIMNGAYSTAFTDVVSAAPLADMLEPLSAISNKDIEAYAAEKSLPIARVRNAYYRALANVLEAEIMVNPASDEKYRNLQIILSLFLSDAKDTESETTRDTIRKNMTKEHARSIAKVYGLPTGFVEFVIMDDNWNDEDWSNDNDWSVSAGWTPSYEDSYDDSFSGTDYIDSFFEDSNFEDSDIGLKIGDRDSASSTRVAELQKKLIALGYLSGKADGIFGPKTQAALVEFQLANGLTATGVYDNDTESKLLAQDVVGRNDYVESFYTDTDDFDDSISYNDSYADSVDYDNSYEASYSDSYETSYDDSYETSYDDSFEASYDDSADAPAATQKPSVSYDDSYEDSYEASYDDSVDVPAATQKPSVSYDDSYEDSYEASYDDSYEESYDDSADSDDYENS